jgi:hypothetical protein
MRSALGDAAYQRAWAEGAAWDFDHAWERALVASEEVARHTRGAAAAPTASSVEGNAQKKESPL